MADSVLHWERQGQGATAVVFIHGFAGKSAATWGKFPSFVCSESALDGWDVATMGYSTSLAPGLLQGIWTGSPSLETLAGLLAELVQSGDLREYRGIALVAHSMGGLVVQRALLDSPQLRQRVSHVLLYGTPSDGLKKALWFRRWKRQVYDMAIDSSFITTLREDWASTFADPKFVFRAIAGDEDQFVPPRSSLGPFPKRQQGVVTGNHLSMVKPDHAAHPSVQLMVAAMQGEAAPEGPWDSARLALETLDFQDVVERLLPKMEGLEDGNRVTLALALDALGRGNEARAVLEAVGRTGTDAQGVLAGRLKRQWNSDGQKDDAERALSLYRDAYETSRANANDEQAYYHGINVAFMTALYLNDHGEARTIADQVLRHCDNAQQNHWCLATKGEAEFYRGQWDLGLESYAAAILARASPREIESMYQQAELIIDSLAPADKRDELGKKLQKVFGW